MREKLTAEIAAKYWGCQYRAVYEKSGSIIGVIDSNALSIIGKYKTADIMYQLILTPIDKLTDEHAIEITNICGIKYRDDFYRILAGKELVDFYWRRVSNVLGNDWMKVVDYLRSKGYDIDNGIKLGWAINKTNEN